MIRVTNLSFWMLMQYVTPIARVDDFKGYRIMIKLLGVGQKGPVAFYRQVLV